MTPRSVLAVLARTAASVAAVYVLFALPPFLLVHAMHWLPTSVDPWFVVFALQAAFFMIVALLLRMPLAAISLAGFGANAAGARAAFWLLSGEVLFAVVGAVTAVSTSDAAATGFTVENGMRALTRELPHSGLAGAFVQKVILAPTFEEFVFRAFLLGCLLKPLRPWLALLISTALFASVHWSWLTASFAGVVYGLLYLRYGNVWLCILVHAASNLLVANAIPMLIAYLHERDLFHRTQGSLLMLQSISALVVLACFAMFLACLHRKDEVTPPALFRSG
jgi:membrane protease YdiL (CAAX protease family)